MAYRHVTTDRLRTAVSIEHRVDRDNALGEAVPTWVALVPRQMVEWIPQTTRERMGSGQVMTPSLVQVRMRWRSGITAQMRLRRADTGEAFAIVAEPVDAEGARKTLELLISTEVADVR